MKLRTRHTVLFFCTIMFTSLGNAQWPQPGSGGEIRRFASISTGGCAISGDDAQKIRLSDLRYNSPPFSRGDPDEPISKGFIIAATDAGLAFDVDAEYGVYDDSSPNALAIPVDITTLRNQKPDGTVLIGRRLILEEQRRSQAYWGTSVTLFIAHEFAHIRQFKKRLNLPIQQRELHADYMAGWYLGAWNRNTGGTYANMEFAARALFSKGDYEFNALASHGSPEKRVSALKAGYRVGLARYSMEDAFRSGVDFVQK